MTKAAQKIWDEVDRYFAIGSFRPMPHLTLHLQPIEKQSCPRSMSRRCRASFLSCWSASPVHTACLKSARSGGYSTIWLARALPTGGQVVTLELEPRHAEIARANLQNAGMLDRVDVRVGRAADLLRALVAGNTAPFDLIFIDADKASYPEYLDWSLKLSRPGTVIVADNVVRDGKVIEPDNPDPNIQGVRRFTDLVAAEPRLSSTVLQTVGSKGYDGFALAIVLR